MSWDIVISSEKETQFIGDEIVAFNKSNAPFTQDNDFVSLNFHIKNDNGLIIAGVNSVMYCWGMLYISVLFVAKDFRGQQLGSLLLNKVEYEAKLMGASLSHLDTFDWQAKDFYLKEGYEVFGVLDACPPGHKRYYLKKTLLAHEPPV
ncbi:MAG: GNAT family N-acetyltransferase [Tatlockia sp.]|nr:GNAT family N-acetyltransferase [Tatlockia sp.]